MKLFTSVCRGMIPLAILLGLAAAVIQPAASSTPVVQDWVARYTGQPTGADDARSIAVDGAGNVYVTGSSEGAGTGSDYATVSYTPAGVQRWVARYNGPGNDEDLATAIVVDGAGNSYVTGMSIGSGTSYDLTTVSYSPTGTERWVRRYNGPANGSDSGRAMVLDTSGNVNVVGWSNGVPGVTGLDFVTLSYASDGTQRWVQRFSRQIWLDDIAKAIDVDSIGNVYVVGSCPTIDSADDFGVVSYSADGVFRWSRFYNGPGNSSDGANAVAVSSSGDVYVTGSSFGGVATNYDFGTIKYTSSGDVQWVRRYTRDGSSQELPSAAVVDVAGNLYVTGYSNGFPTRGIVTVSYSPDGTQRWESLLSGAGSLFDLAQDLALDAEGNLYLAGYSGGTEPNSDYLTVSYTSAGAQRWSMSYNGPGSGTDHGRSLAVDATGSVYVTGVSAGGSTGDDFATVKYSVPPPDVTPPTIAAQAVGLVGASNGLPYVPVLVTDSGSGVARVQLTNSSSNCHLEYPLGTRLVPNGTALPHTYVLPSAQSAVTVYAVKDTNAKARVEIRAWDASDNSALADPIIASLQIKTGQRLTRVFKGIPEQEHYISLQNGTPGLSGATLWVNGEVVSRGSLSAGQVVSLNVAAQMRPGKRNTVRITASGAKSSQAMLLIGDASLTSAGRSNPGNASVNLEFAR